MNDLPYDRKDVPEVSLEPIATLPSNYLQPFVWLTSTYIAIHTKTANAIEECDDDKQNKEMYSTTSM
jgi:hypothetical protein